MNKLIIVVVLSGLIFGCGHKQSDSNIAIKVNDYSISIVEFNQEYSQAKALRRETLKSKDEFIQEIIAKKTLLQEAQRQGIDKEPDFLRTIEHFWEQSLITILLKRKSNELSGDIKVTAEEIQDYYNKMSEEEKAELSLDELSKQIELIISHIKESQALSDWMHSVKENSQIFIDKSITEIE